MALLLYDGFDLNATAQLKWTRSLSPNFDVSTRFGTGYMFLANTTRYLEYDLASATSRLILGFASWMAVGALSTTTSLFSLLDSTTQQCTVCVESDGSFSLRRGSKTGTIVAQSAANKAPHGSSPVWGFVEVDVTVHGTTGAVQLWLDGTSVMSATGINSRMSANNSATTLRLGHDNTGGADNPYFDDFYLLDTTGSTPFNDRLGDIRIFTQVPSGAGASTDWVPNTGSNYQAVDEIGADDDSTYVRSATTNAKDLYAINDLPGTFSGSVLSVSVATRMRKDDAGPRSAAATVRSNGVDADGTTRALNTAYQSYWDRFDKNPDGNVDWTSTTVNALQAGVKVVS